MGELHLEILVDRMKREFKVEANVGAPQVAYREYLAKPVELDLHPQEAVGRLGPVRPKSRSASIPGERGSGFHFIDEIKGGNVPKEYIPSVEKGMRETAETGSLIGFPIIDFEVAADRRQVSRRQLVGAGVRDRAAAARCAKRPRRPASSCSSRS